MALVFGVPSPVSDSAVASGSKELSETRRAGFTPIELAPAQRPLEPEAVAMLLHANEKGVAAAKRAAADPTDGVQAELQANWPRLLKHLHNICEREDLADVHRERAMKPARTVLQQIIEEEWLIHGFAGALASRTLLWVWDQFALQGWELAAKIAACSLWLLRIEIRRLDRVGAGATELRGCIRAQLQNDKSLYELMAMTAGASAQSRERGYSSRTKPSRKPQVMIQLPVGWGAAPMPHSSQHQS